MSPATAVPPADVLSWLLPEADGPYLEDMTFEEYGQVRDNFAVSYATKQANLAAAKRRRKRVSTDLFLNK